MLRFRVLMKRHSYLNAEEEHWDFEGNHGGVHPSAWHQIM